MENKKSLKNILEWINCIIIAIILALLFRYYIGTPTVVKKSSMYPTLQENQRLLLNRWLRTAKKLPNRGDIITFEKPSTINYTADELDKLNPIAKYEDSSKNLIENFSYYVLEINKESYIKRVIGLPGEHIEIRDGNVYINGELLQEEYLREGVTTNSTIFTELTVPDGYIFVMGDNRSDSMDSRNFGCIPVSKVESKVCLRFWPFSKFGTKW